MCEWKECKLGDVANIKGGKRLPLGKSLTEMSTRHPYIRTRDINNHKISINELLFVPDDVFPSISRYIVEKQDIILSIVGTIGLCVIVPDALHLASLTENCAKIVDIDSQKLNHIFLYYYLISADGQDEIARRNVGSTQPKLPLYNIKNIPIPIPPLPEQRAIASVLSSLDDKIDLLHRQNKTLEGMAETLFRQWFVEEAEEGWGATTLEQHIEVFRGLSYKGSGLTESGFGIPMHNLNSVYEGGGYKIEGIKFYSSEYKKRHLVYPGDIIVTNTEQGHEFKLIGFPAIVPDSFGDTGLFSQHIYKLVSKKQTNLSREFIYYLLMSHSVREQIISATNGSTVNMLAIDGLQRPEFKLPPKNKVIEFTAIVSAYWNKSNINNKQIRTLEKLRDTLLPKLMSGEVKVEV